MGRIQQRPHRHHCRGLQICRLQFDSLSSSFSVLRSSSSSRICLSICSSYIPSRRIALVHLSSVMELTSCGSAPTEARGDVSERALQSSMAETLQDRARNSMDSVGVSGGGHVARGQLAGLSSSMFSSLFSEHFEP